MDVTPVDERDSHWEEHRPRFRVYLHGGAGDGAGGWTDTYDITGADALQVIDWAQRRARDQLSYAVAIVSGDAAPESPHPGRGRGLVWLVGMDGNDSTDGSAYERSLQERMVARRHEPVGIPRSDRAPDDAEPVRRSRHQH